jgi:O-antigen ligase
VGAIGLEAYALYYEAQRTILFLSVFAIGVTIAARYRVRPLGVAICGVVAMFGLIFFAGKFTSGGTAVCHEGDQACVLSQRANSVANPTGEGSSLSGHMAATRKGMASAFTRPLGYGVGAATLAAGKFNSQRAARGTEFDPGNAGTSLGIVGLLLYPSMVIFAFRAAYRVAMRRRDLISLFCIGAMSVDLMQWMNGDLYSVTWLVWLFIGWAESQSMKTDTELDNLGEVAERVHPSVAPVEAATSDVEEVRSLRRSRWA